MRKPTPPVSESTPTPPPPNQHTHEVIIRRRGSTVVIRCYGIAAAEREARLERRTGVDVEIVEVGK